MSNYTDAVAQALAKTVNAKITQARTLVRRGTVTVVGTDGTVEFSVGDLGERLGIALNSTPAVGDTIIYLDDGSAMPIVLGSLGRLVPPEPRFYSGSVSNGTATSATAIITQNSILVAPCNLIMVVQVVGNQGANAVTNDVGYAVWDEAGNNIMLDPGAIVASTLILRNAAADQRSAIAMTGRKAYTTGQTCGFRVVYAVSASNIYASVAATVTFHPDV